MLMSLVLCLSHKCEPGLRCKAISKVHNLLFYVMLTVHFVNPAEAAEEDTRNEENVDESFLRQVRYISSRFSSARTAFHRKRVSF